MHNSASPPPYLGLSAFLYLFWRQLSVEKNKRTPSLHCSWYMAIRAKAFFIFLDKMKKDIPVMTFVFLLRFIFREHWFLSWKTHWAPQRAWHLSLWSLIDASTGLPCISMYLQIYEICRYKQKLKAQWKVQKYDWVTSLQINFHLTFCSSVSVCQAPLSSIQASKRKSRARQTLPWMVGKQTLFVLQVIFPVLFHIKKKEYNIVTYFYISIWVLEDSNKRRHRAGMRNIFIVVLDVSAEKGQKR